MTSNSKESPETSSKLVYIEYEISDEPLELFLELSSIISMCYKLFSGSKALLESKTSIQ